jgi:hypothetical protein
MNDDELLMTAASRVDLVPEAAHALDSEMARRQLSYQEAHAKKREVARLEIKEADETPFFEEEIEVLRCKSEWVDAAAVGSWRAPVCFSFDGLPHRPGRMALSHTFRLHGCSYCRHSRSTLAKTNVKFLDLSCCFLHRATACGLLAQRPPSATNERRTKGSRGSYHPSGVRGRNTVIPPATEAGSGERFSTKLPVARPTMARVSRL